MNSHFALAPEFLNCVNWVLLIFRCLFWLRASGATAAWLPADPRSRADTLRRGEEAKELLRAKGCVRACFVRVCVVVCARAERDGRGCVQRWNERGQKMLMKRGVTFAPSSGTSAETEEHRGGGGRVHGCMGAWVHGWLGGCAGPLPSSATAAPLS